MRILPEVTPTREQLPLLLDSRPGTLVIRGAAGSGKTTTALLRLKQLCATWLSRKRRLGLPGPVRVLVLTYNRTLEGYIAELARRQVDDSEDLQLEVKTFSKFAVKILGPQTGLDPDVTSHMLLKLMQPFGMPTEFLSDEVEYVLGRFKPTEIEDYVDAQRDGRGTSPRMEAKTRGRLLDEVIYPYLAEKKAKGLMDWNDIAVKAGQKTSDPWDVVIVDEAQDFSANQVRTILQHLSVDYSLTFVLDAAQRIYPRSFTWKEAGVGMVTSRSLTSNYRNTCEIAAFACSLISGMPLGDDGTLPDFESAQTHGEEPRILVGKMSDQVSWVLRERVLPAASVAESVAFLHPRGGQWFSYIQRRLTAANIETVKLTRSSIWPSGDETVALSTIHSAKGLEFDHVIILGLNQEVTPHGDENGDAELENHRRLLAMGIGRAQKTVTLGFKPGEASTLIKLFEPTTYTEVSLQ